MIFFFSLMRFVLIMYFRLLEAGNFLLFGGIVNFFFLGLDILGGILGGGFERKLCKFNFWFIF